jgi:diaminopropionate ammonia-lyase
MNIPCVIFLPARAAPERIENIRREGARIVLVDGIYEDAVRQCDVESNRQGWQIISDVGYEGYLEIPPLVVEGYSTLYGEVDEQLAESGWPEPHVVMIPGGVGGILHAGVDHYRARTTPPRLVGVEPAEGDCLTESLASGSGEPAISRGNRKTTMACLNCSEVSWPSWPPIRRGVDGLLALDDRYAVLGVQALYRAEGGETALEAGNSGAATTGGLMALMGDDSLQDARDHLGLGPRSVVLCLCTEAAIDQTEFHRVIGA